MIKVFCGCLYSWKCVKERENGRKKERKDSHMAKYTLMKTEGRAKRAQFETVHGTIQTPVFMNVGTVGAIKGAVSTMDLK